MKLLVYVQVHVKKILDKKALRIPEKMHFSREKSLDNSEMQ